MQDVDAYPFLKVYGWAADNNGCGYYRIGLPAQALRQRGHLTYASTVLEAHADIADVIIGQRVAREGPSALWQLLASNGKKLIYELDDDLFNVDPTSQIAYEYFSQRDVRERIRQNIAVASAVTCTTEYLADELREYNENVLVVPNFIDASVLSIREPKNERVTLGWAGSTTHEMDFREAGRFLRKLAERVGDVHFQFSGADYGRKLFPAERYTFRPFSQDITEHYRTVSTLDIGIAPLRRHRFNNSKSYVKALEYAALGVPAIVSDELPYRDFVRDGETGFLVRNEYDWIKYARALAEDEDLRTTIAANAFAVAQENTIQANIGRWEEAIRSVLD